MKNEIKQLYKVLIEEPDDRSKLYMYGALSRPAEAIWAWGSTAFAKALLDKIWII